MKKSLRFGEFLFLFILIIASLPAQEAPGFALSLNPGVELPVGRFSSIYGTGGSAALRAAYPIPGLTILSVIGEIGYAVNAYNAETGFSSLDGSAGAAVTLPLGAAFSLGAYGLGGYGLSFLKIGGETMYGGGPYVRVGGGAAFHFSPSFSVGAEVSYRLLPQLYNGIGFHLGAQVDLAAVKRSSAQISPLTGDSPAGNFLDVKNLKFGQVFPVFYSYYDDHSIGSATVVNPQDKPIRDVRISFNVKQFMAAPKVCASFGVVDAGSEKAIDLFALFNDSILSITEGTKVAAEISLEYSLEGVRYKDTVAHSLEMEHRNALTWDDDSKAAAFITAKDPQVLLFAKNTAGVVNAAGGYAVPAPLVMAMGLHESLRLYGLTYVIDPSTPYANLSENQLQVDYLQFPRETLEYRAGDCDDLSILFNALLESVGIETAFITVPGHIFVAFSIGIEPDEVRKSFLKADEFIFRENTSWIPVEITALGSNFLEAWQEGAKQWREHSGRSQAGFFSVHEAWDTYKPVGLPGERPAMSMPAREAVAAALDAQINRFIDREIYPQVAQLQEAMSKANDPAKYANKLGVLYAKYGLFEKAVPQLSKALEYEEYLPALINLGNISFLRERMTDAKGYYERALVLAPDNPKVLLSVAKVHHELENYGMVRQVYAQLQKIDESLAVQFAYLDLRGDEASRAAEVSGMKNKVLWDEEE